MSVLIPIAAMQRVLSKYVADENGCWISGYSVGSHGYAQIGWWDKSKKGSAGTTAHRAAWSYANGQQVPEGMEVDHICHVRRCVNPDHLQLLPASANHKKTYKGYSDTTCKRGHERDGNTYIDRRGLASCTVCKSMTKKERNGG